MLKNCSACKNKHSPPYGQYCKHTQEIAMAAVDVKVPDRDDPAYIDYLEGKLAATQQKVGTENETLNVILQRLDKKEISTACEVLSCRTPVPTTVVPTSIVYDISLSLANDSVSSYINDCVTDGDHIDECTTSSQVNDCVMLCGLDSAVDTFVMYGDIIDICDDSLCLYSHTVGGLYS